MLHESLINTVCSPSNSSKKLITTTYLRKVMTFHSEIHYLIKLNDSSLLKDLFAFISTGWDYLKPKYIHVIYGIFFQVITVILLWFFLGVQGHWYSAQCLLGMKLMGGEVCLPRIHNHAYTSELNRCMLRLIPRMHLSNYV